MTDTNAPETGGKEYYQDPERISDLINAALFSGDVVARPEYLTEKTPEDHDTREILETEAGGSEGESASGSEALWSLKLPDGGRCRVALMSLENHANVDLWLPLRAAERYVARYADEKDEAVDAFQEVLKNNPNLRPESEKSIAKKRRGDLLTPVFPIVLYYGEEPWSGPRSFRELFDVPPGLQSYFPEIPMRLIEMRSEELIFHEEGNKIMSEMFRDAASTETDAGAPGGPLASLRAAVNAANDALARGVERKKVVEAAELFDWAAGTHIARIIEETEEKEGDTNMSWNLWERAIQELKEEAKLENEESEKERKQLRAENEELRAENASLRAQLAKLPG